MSTTKEPTIRSFKEWVEVMNFVESRINESLPKGEHIYKHLFLEESIKFFHHAISWHWGEPDHYNEGATYITYEQFDDYRLEYEILKTNRENK